MDARHCKATYRVLSAFDRTLFTRQTPAEARIELWRTLDATLAAQLFSKVDLTITAQSELLKSLEECLVLRKQINPYLQVARSIYELMLLRTTCWVERPDVIYRGHANERWELIPSWYRQGIERNIQIYHTAINRRYERIRKERGVRELKLSPLEREAVVQHYGSGTLLVDFTTSFRVAAFFATFPIGNLKGKRGKIYALDCRRLQEHGFSVLKTADVPKEYVRIHTTRACFLQSWGRGDDFADRGYVKRRSESESGPDVHFAGREGLEDPNRYSLEARWIDMHGETWEFHFDQGEDVFEDDIWGITQQGLSY